MGSCFVTAYAWISKLLRDAAFTWRPRELSCWLKEWLIFGEFGYLSSSCIRKSIILMFWSSSRDKFMLLQRTSVKDVSVGFWPPCWCPSGWAPAWRLHTNLCKFGWKVSPHILHRKYCHDPWILARGFAYLPSFSSQILDFIYWTVLILFWSILNGTEN